MFQSSRVTTLTAQLHSHSLYGAVQTPEALRIFAEHHVFAVWDFMSLLKSLQRSLTCVTVPWMPPASGRIARLINEIVLGEESDTMPTGDSTSHFELYRGAMHEVGASTASIDLCLALLSQGVSLPDALTRAQVPAPVVPFVQTTFQIIDSGRTHAIAAAFALGREDLVPQMFTRVTTQSQLLRATHPQFFYYLDRHIEVDGDTHGPLALEMLSILCAGDPLRLTEAEDAIVLALQARLDLWDGIVSAIGDASRAPSSTTGAP